ncbi:DUF4190 domain-containing protein [Motilibacter sp. E257]|uniref:DUF4190 domain-containing protein n=2 Tax=Motilibacter deserti TaxID=2714956 RepID=A0ABX0H3H8_9ACTN|nr:DUF4190 domain-containing protein [Motilibacter deserti]NHC16292.1 DUF4190 domain-containing protein [Motilibacter deserti]
MAIAALILGILALLTGWLVVGSLFGLIAIVLGIVGLRRAKGGVGGKGMSIAGIVLGVLGILTTVLVIAAGVALFNSDEFQNLQDCLQSAGNDQAAVEDCQREFNSGVTNGQ